MSVEMLSVCQLIINVIIWTILNIEAYHCYHVQCSVHIEEIFRNIQCGLGHNRSRPFSCSA
jgi:hypothetical protein